MTIRNNEIAGISSYLDALAAYAPTVWLGPFVEARARLNFNYQGAPPMRLNPQSLNLFAKLDAHLKDLATRQDRWRYISLVDAFALQPDFLQQGGLRHLPGCRPFQPLRRRYPRGKDESGAKGMAIPGAALKTGKRPFSTALLPRHIRRPIDPAIQLRQGNSDFLQARVNDCGPVRR